MTALAELLGLEAPLPLTTPVEDQEDVMETDQSPSRWIAALIVLAVLAGIAVVVLGIVYGGPWRWAGDAVAVVGIVAIVVPGLADRKNDNGIEEKK
ncbi:hypothetical protein SAMN04488550_0595 [Gordonia malaquae]|uniref:Uncharacterized protein n=1 Tax=Gordonia malaquae NBRC 108250 TaxID=1223542 RepID=M3VBT9_GORML|nr:hypothetical protein [Gordonia malaquae]GAC80843.1 hypothetical protein GM1_023_00020 [Gordonia malaquae NBRC 108250]SEB67372.1 hypothetical protein SAMN04488550_0595 [Gordonia malaquae]